MDTRAMIAPIYTEESVNLLPVYIDHIKIRNSNLYLSPPTLAYIPCAVTVSANSATCHATEPRSYSF